LEGVSVYGKVTQAKRKNQEISIYALIEKQTCDPSDDVRTLELKAIVAYPVIPKLFQNDPSSCYHYETFIQ
jgi:hypothetical protein